MKRDAITLLPRVLVLARYASLSSMVIVVSCLELSTQQWSTYCTEDKPLSQLVVAYGDPGLCGAGEPV